MDISANYPKKQLRSAVGTLNCQTNPISRVFTVAIMNKITKVKLSEMMSDID
jgi:hypothetical protein